MILPGHSQPTKVLCGTTAGSLPHPAELRRLYMLVRNIAMIKMMVVPCIGSTSMLSKKRLAEGLLERCILRLMRTALNT